VSKILIELINPQIEQTFKCRVGDKIDLLACTFGRGTKIATEIGPVHVSALTWICTNKKSTFLHAFPKNANISVWNEEQG
jgi:hypothetical protein